MTLIDFYYDFSSPNAYFAAAQLPPLAEKYGADIAWRPFLLGGVFKTLGTPAAPLMNTPQKAAHTMADLARWSRHYGVPFNFPSRFPMNTVRALRTALALEAAGANTHDFVRRAFDAYWVDDEDLADPNVIASLLTAAGHEAGPLLSSIETPEIKAALKAATEKALERGVFGTPTFIIGDELFFGKDRLAFVEAALAENQPAP